MRRFAIIVALASLPLAACSDLKLGQAQARHREYVCSHQVAVTAAANFALENASRIRGERLRVAAIAAAQAELDIVAACPAPGVA